jgi:hypothetical protein
MMTKFLSGAIATVLAATFAVASAPPLNAAPVYVPNTAPVANTGKDVEQVQYRWRRGGPAYYGRYRGYRGPRAGYRYYNGWWFPAAAFVTGAIIGGALAQPEPIYRPRYGRNSHVDWCYARYRSYRASDNTFQPYEGPRRQCVSPYG